MFLAYFCFFFLVLVYSCSTSKIKFEKFVLFPFASVRIFIQIVPLCDYNNNNIRKQVRVAFEYGLFNK